MSYRTRAYVSWTNIKQRCLNPKNTSYSDYGARGITVCESWLKFNSFLADMGEPPEGCEIDRIDNEGHYEPNNCRWVTREHNSRNKRNSYIFNGEHLSEIADRIGMPRKLLYQRVARDGMSIEDAISRPVTSSRAGIPHKNKKY